MNKLTRITCLATVALTGLADFAAAQGNTNGPVNEQGRRHGFRAHRMMKALEQVGVTDQQKQQIKTIMRESRPTMQPLVQQLRTERKALREAIQASPVNEGAIRAASTRVAQVEADLAVARAHVQDRVRGVLTPDQAAKLKQMQADWQAKREQRMKEGAQGPENSGT
jgi:Spy/CpxP family protein refolding chaperone